jgi:alkylation response protein AidB-like acyl-CoA dehydrogenase
MSTGSHDVDPAAVRDRADDSLVGAALDRYVRVARACGGHVEPLLDALRDIPPAGVAPMPGSGATAERFRLLARVAEADVSAARVLEPHADAVAIIVESGGCAPERGTTWGVFAAEAPGHSVDATVTAGQWTLNGSKAWCSLGTKLTHALVTASTGSTRRMFSVDLRDARVAAQPSPWVARGLAEVTSGPLTFRAAPAAPIGDAGWYLDRPGFRWGAIGVAACWWGGCLPLAAALSARSRSRPDDDFTAAALGRVYRHLEAGRSLLLASASAIDEHSTRDAVDFAVLAHAVRGTIADAVREVLRATEEVLGPAALAFDEDLARRYADLELYVSQYHWNRDDASLARRLPEDVVRW